MKKRWITVHACIQLYLLVHCVVGATTNNLSRAEDTNAVPTETDISRFPWKKIVSTNTIEERFELYLGQRLEVVSVRKLHPFNTMTRLLTAESQDQLDSRISELGKSLVKTSLEHSVRESVKDIPFVYFAINQKTFLAKLFRDSIGNTEEEYFQAGTTSYATNELSKWETVSGNNVENTNSLSRWKRVTRNVHPRYGLRLDYAYVAFTVGRNDDKPLMFADIRYHYNRLGLGDVMTTDIESLISIPLSSKTLLTFGSEQEINPPDWNRRWSFKVSQKLDGSRLFIGVTVRETPTNDRTRYIIGFERLW